MSDEARVEGDDLARDLKALEIGPEHDTNPTKADGNADADADADEQHGSQRVLVLDAGYGFPREKKVRKEKINAISSQLSNFLVWQIGAKGSIAECPCALIRVVGCADENVKKLLKDRTIENMKRATATVNCTELPSHVTISCETLEDCLKDLAADNPASITTSASDVNVNEPVYLSPDAPKLDPCNEPPKVAIVGLLIDRRVQPNRSRDRAQNIGIVARRWPLEDCFAEINSHEPLNVDCVLEGMQQWWWNWKDTSTSSSDGAKKEAFVQAASQAIQHHVKRHPSRPLHIDKSK